MSSAPIPYNSALFARLLEDDNTSACVIMTVLYRMFEDKIFGDAEDEEGMTPTEIYAEVNDRFGIWMPEENENKFQAALAALLSDDFYDEPQVFLAVCHTLYDGDLPLKNGVLDDEFPSYVEMVWSIAEVGLMRESLDGDDEHFSRRVQEVIMDVAEAEVYDFDVVQEEMRDAFRMMLEDFDKLEVPREALDLGEFKEAQKTVDMIVGENP